MPVDDIVATQRIAEPTFGGDGEWLTPKDVSEMVGLSVATLRDYRSTRGLRYGPPFHKHGCRAFYRLSEVLNWIDIRSANQGRVEHD